MRFSILLALGSLIVHPTFAADGQESLEKRIERLEKSQQRSIEALNYEVTRLKENSRETDFSSSGFMGLGAGASKVYFSKSELSIGGYGEIIYKDPRGGTSGNTTDVYRVVPYISYRFSDSLIFNSEIEFEHGDEVGVEFAYLDFIISPGLGLRAGHILLPIGVANLRHEPTYFQSVLRPEVETNLIPSTWHENGVLLYGTQSNWRYHLGVVNGLKAESSPTHPETWIRDFRQGGGNAQAEDLAAIGRVDWSPRSNLEVGASYYTGDSGQMGTVTLGRGHVDLWEAHLSWAAWYWELEALWAQGQLKDVHFTPATILPGKGVEGGHISIAHDVLRGKFGPKKLKLFARYSAYDLQDELQAEASQKDRTLDKKIWTVGVNYFPHPQVVVKGSLDIRRNAEKDEDDRLDLGLGLVF